MNEDRSRQPANTNCYRLGCRASHEH